MNNIKDIRATAGLNQHDFAKFLNTTQSNISGWELNKWQPDSEALIKISRLFNVTIDYILGNEEYLNISNELNTIKQSNNEKLLLKHFRQMNESGQLLAITQLECISKTKELKA